MLHLCSGKRYSSKLSLPSQGTDRQRFSDPRGCCEIEITLYGKKKKVSFQHVIPIGQTVPPFSMTESGLANLSQLFPSKQGNENSLSNLLKKNVLLCLNFININNKSEKQKMELLLSSCVKNLQPSQFISGLKFLCKMLASDLATSS